jgi:hypothetical protein
VTGLALNTHTKEERIMSGTNKHLTCAAIEHLTILLSTHEKPGINTAPIIIAAPEDFVVSILDFVKDTYGYEVLDWRKEGSQSAPNLYNIVVSQSQNVKIAFSCTSKFPIILHWFLDNLRREGILNPTDTYSSDKDYIKIKTSSIIILMSSEEAICLQKSIAGKALSRMGIMVLHLYH